MSLVCHKVGPNYVKVAGLDLNESLVICLTSQTTISTKICIVFVLYIRPKVHNFTGAGRDKAEHLETHPGAARDTHFRMAIKIIYK